MMLELGPYRLDLDVARTGDFYAGAPRLQEACGCGNCRNFTLAIEEKPQALAFFRRLGVEMAKVREAYVTGPNPDGALEYRGFCHLSGRLLSGTGEFAAAPDLLVSFGASVALPEPDFPEPMLQMDFCIQLPWVLESPHTYKE